jgi:amidase
MASFDPFSSALELAGLIAKKKVSPVEVVDEYLRRTDKLNPALNAVTWRRDEAVRKEAKDAEQAVMKGEARGPFFGVPIAIKDLLHIEGWPITYGSRAAKDNVCWWTSNAAASFRAAGFLFLHRTNTPEFGIVSVTENQLYGATRNPWNPERTPGGSSGGSAAAVAAGMVPIAHANDGGGSIRIPASCAGLVGLKPSRGRVSSGPLVSDVMHGGAVEGCVSRTVADTAAVLDTISAFDPTAWYNAPAPSRPFANEVGTKPGQLRIAFTTTAPTGVPVEPSCVEAVQRTAAILAELGHEVFEGAPNWPDVNAMLPGFITVWNTGVAYYDVADWNQVEPLTRAMRDQAAATDSLKYVRSLAEMQVFSRQIVQSWGRDFDLLLTPTCAIEPPKVGWVYETTSDDPMEPLFRAGVMAPFTLYFNLTGQPAISLPLHTAPSGLPIGIQLVGKPWGEAELIRIASQLEQAAPWRDRKPSMAA